MKNVTKQETFDKVARHLLTQNRKALSPTNACRYRALDGSMCAAGVLIPGDKYSQDIEGGIVAPDADADETTDSRCITINTIITDEGHDLKLVRALQEVHDDGDVNWWKTKLIEVAVKFELDAACVQEFTSSPSPPPVSPPSV